jgi:thiol-disulfide isomerase/thioredoxin
MRAVLFSALCALVLLAGCNPGPVRTSEPSLAKGWVPATIFLADPGHESFKDAYQKATVDSNLTGMIRGLCQGVDVIVFYGQWCGDSKRHVPRFMRVVEASGWEQGRIRYYALDRSKKSGDGLTERYSVELVPTFIFLRNNEELGRIVESPRSTLEGDMIQILVPKPG